MSSTRLPWYVLVKKFHSKKKKREKKDIMSGRASMREQISGYHDRKYINTLIEAVI